MSSERNAVISALIGLAGACGNSGTTKESDRVLLLGLKSLSGAQEEQRRVIDEIHKIRDSIAPGCTVCQVPCGNTADYDLSKLNAQPEKMREMKSSMLELAGRAAVSAETPSGSFCTALYELIQGLTEDEDISALQEIMEEVRPVLEPENI